MGASFSILPAEIEPVSEAAINVLSLKLLNYRVDVHIDLKKIPKIPSRSIR
jgi:hypothetical protein